MKIALIMAHITRLKIPIEFVFEVEQANWRAGQGRPVGWSRCIGGGLVLEVVEPFPYEGLRGIVPDEQVPEIAQRIRSGVGGPYEFGNLNQEVERAFGDQRIDVLICDSPNRVREGLLNAMGLGPVRLPPQSQKIDPWILRDEFLHLKRKTADLVRFLNTWGNWSGEAHYSGPEDLSVGSEKMVRFVFEDSIWAYQDRFKRALGAEPFEWLSNWHFGNFAARPNFPHFVRRANTCREAIELTIAFDFIQGSKFRLCALKDCRVPFKRESDHKRRFCSQYHAHLDSVRRNRRLAALAKQKGSPKKERKTAGGRK